MSIVVLTEKPMWPVYNPAHRLAQGCVGAWAFASAGQGPSSFPSQLDSDASGSGGLWSVTSNPCQPTIDRGMSGYNFDGVNDRVAAVNTPANNVGAVGESYTLAVLFRTNGAQADGNNIIIKLDTVSGKYPLDLQIASHLANFSINDAAGHTPNPAGVVVDDSRIHRFVAVRDATAAKVTTYVDGVEAAQATDTTTVSCANAEKIYWGSGRGGLGPFMSGWIYETRLLRAAWTPAMVAEDFLDPFAIYRGSVTDYVARLRGRGTTKVKSSNQASFPGSPSYKPGLMFATQF